MYKSTAKQEALSKHASLQFLEVQHIVKHVIETIAYLNTLNNKSPQAALNNKLHKLVELVSPYYHQDVVDSVLSHDLIKAKRSCLIENLAECEYELEKYWSQKIFSEKGCHEWYPYIHCYKAIVNAETEVLQRYTMPENKNICFVGSGPLPLTAIELKKKYPGISMHAIEKETTAIGMSKDICGTCEVEITYTHATAEQADYSSYDVIFVAAMTVNKRGVFEKIADTAKTGTIIAIRSVDGLRHLLYDPVNKATIPTEFKYLEETPYKPIHVNTTLFYRLEKP